MMQKYQNWTKQSRFFFFKDVRLVLQSFDVRPTVGSVQTQTHTHQKRAGLQCVDCRVYEDGNRATDVLFGTKETGDRQIKGSTALLHLSLDTSPTFHTLFTQNLSVELSKCRGRKCWEGVWGEDLETYTSFYEFVSLSLHMLYMRCSQSKIRYFIWI